MKEIREIFFYGGYFSDFYYDLDPISRKKIDWVIRIVRETEIIPAKFFKHIEGAAGLYEIRITSRRNAFRAFCFFNEKNTLVILNCFRKKTHKTPKNQIVRAKRLRNEYYKQE